MMFFCPKSSESSSDGQLDTTALKAIMNNCKLFEGWYDPKTGDGWLQSFFVVGKIRKEIKNS